MNMLTKYPEKLMESIMTQLIQKGIVIQTSSAVLQKAGILTIRTEKIMSAKKCYKQVIPVIYLLLLLHLPTPVFPQEIETRVELAGVWELALERQMHELQKHKDSKFTAMPEPVQEMFLASLETRKYIFYPDGRFEAYWLLGGKSHVLVGTWEFEFPDILRLSPESGQDKIYAVSVQQEIIKLVSEGNAGNVLHTLYLKREVP